MQKGDTLIITRWDGVHVIQGGKVVERIPLDGDGASKIMLKLKGRMIDEERTALERYPGGRCVPYHPGIPSCEDDLRAIREISFELADLSLRDSFRGDEDIIWGVRLLEEMKNELNTLQEMVRGWDQVHQLSGEESEGFIKMNMFLKEMEKTITNLTRFVEDRMRAIAPSLSEACGPILGARLIEAANGLTRLAMKPSSAVQILGAEKALFRHLRTGVPPPKHGLIFLHPSIQGSPKHERGKKARALASRISRAARRDAFVDRNQK